MSDPTPVAKHDAPDCIIIGGGVIGMLCARELAGEGLKVTLLDKGKTGHEATWAGGGILSPLHPWRYPDAVSAMARWSQAHYPDFAEALKTETGIDPEWVRSGVLVLDPEDIESALAWGKKWQTQIELLSADKAAVCEPALAARSTAAVWLPKLAQARNPRVGRALTESLHRRGVDVREHCAVSGLEIIDGRIHGVHIAEGVLRADRVIVAAGAWSPQLTEGLQTPIKVLPVRGQMLLFRAPKDLVTRIVLDGPRYVIPRLDGRVLAGSTVEFVGFDKDTTASAREELQGAAIDLIPALADYEIEHHWAGLRPGSPNGVPYIGEHPEISGLYINTGHYRNGLGLAPAAVHLLLDLMLDRPPILPPEDYALAQQRPPSAEFPQVT